MILQPDKSDTFSEIFELNAPTDDLLAELGYTYQTKQLNLARQTVNPAAVEQLQAKFYRRLPQVAVYKIATKGKNMSELAKPPIAPPSAPKTRPNLSTSFKMWVVIANRAAPTSDPMISPPPIIKVL